MVILLGDFTEGGAFCVGDSKIIDKPGKFAMYDESAEHYDMPAKGLRYCITAFQLPAAELMPDEDKQHLQLLGFSSPLLHHDQLVHQHLPFATTATSCGTSGTLDDDDTLSIASDFGVSEPAFGSAGDSPGGALYAGGAGQACWRTPSIVVFQWPRHHGMPVTT